MSKSADSSLSHAGCGVQFLLIKSSGGRIVGGKAPSHGMTSHSAVKSPSLKRMW